MPNWTNIDLNSLLPGQPFTSAIALAYEENPRAIAEGAPGAPKTQGVALGGVVLAEGDGSRTTTGTTTILTVLDLGEIKTLLINVTISAGSSISCTLQLRTSENNGASWSSWSDYIAVEGGDRDGTRYYELPSNVNALQFRINASVPSLLGPASGAVQLMVIEGKEL